MVNFDSFLNLFLTLNLDVLKMDELESVSCDFGIFSG